MGGTERPEHTDRPLSDADRIARYEEQVNEYYSRPENRDKLDPFSRMSLDEIKRLYRPDDDDPNRPHAVVKDGTAQPIDPANGQREDRPRWHEEPESSRRIRTDWGDADAGDPEPTGTELLEPENDKGSRFERLTKEAFKNTDDLVDATRDRGNELETALKGPQPSGTETRQAHPIPYVTERRPHEAGVGDVLSGALAISLACYAIGYHARRCFQKFGKGPEDASH